MRSASMCAELQRSGLLALTQMAQVEHGLRGASLGETPRERQYTRERQYMREPQYTSERRT